MASNDNSFTSFDERSPVNPEPAVTLTGVAAAGADGDNPGRMPESHAPLAPAEGVADPFGETAGRESAYWWSGPEIDLGDLDPVYPGSADNDVQTMPVQADGLIETLKRDTEPGQIKSDDVVRADGSLIDDPGAAPAVSPPPEAHAPLGPDPLIDDPGTGLEGSGSIPDAHGTLRPDPLIDDPGSGMELPSRVPETHGEMAVSPDWIVPGPRQNNPPQFGDGESGDRAPWWGGPAVDPSELEFKPLGPEIISMDIHYPGSPETVIPDPPDPSAPPPSDVTSADSGLIDDPAFEVAASDAPESHGPLPTPSSAEEEIVGAGLGYRVPEASPEAPESKPVVARVDGVVEGESSEDGQGDGGDDALDPVPDDLIDAASGLSGPAGPPLPSRFPPEGYRLGDESGSSGYDAEDYRPGNEAGYSSQGGEYRDGTAEGAVTRHLGDGTPVLAWDTANPDLLVLPETHGDLRLDPLIEDPGPGVDVPSLPASHGPLTPESGDEGDETPIESVGVVFGDVEADYREHDDRGGLGSGGTGPYDIESKEGGTGTSAAEAPTDDILPCEKGTLDDAPELIEGQGAACQLSDLPSFDDGGDYVVQPLSDDAGAIDNGIDYWPAESFTTFVGA